MAHLFKLAKPASFLQFNVFALIVGATLGVAIVFMSTRAVQEDSRAASRAWSSAVLVSSSATQVGDLLSVLTNRAALYVGSPEVDALPPEQQLEVRNVLANTGEPLPDDLPVLLIPVSIPEALSIQTTLGVMQGQVTSLLKTETSPDARKQIEDYFNEFQTILNLYFGNPTLLNFNAVRQELIGLRLLIRSATPAFMQTAEAHERRVEEMTRLVWIASLLCALGVVAILAVLSAAAARRIREVLELATSETNALEEASASLSRRNAQLTALYSIFNEITDTLSVRYVVSTTIREVINLVDAEVVILRLVRDEQLVVAGSLTAEGTEIEGLTTLGFGDGAVGRVAKRGKTLRIDRDAQNEISDQGPWTKTMQSGVLLPLIVGAKVVGTLSAWSARTNAFSDEDQRILEMMGSQVATAIAAAETTEATERLAQHDPLTGLLNRRQLAEDIAGPLRDMVRESPVSIAMVDIDNFKRFNDEFGHRVGDATLQKVSAVLRGSVRESDLVYRYGGEEFLIIFPGVRSAEAVPLAERVRLAVQATPFFNDAFEPLNAVTISLGIAGLPDHGLDLLGVIALADDAMYESKKSGRNKITVWGDNLVAKASTAA